MQQWDGLIVKSTTALTLGLIGGALGLAFYGTPLAGAIGFGIPHGFWLFYEMLRFGAFEFVIEIIGGIFELLSSG